MQARGCGDGSDAGWTGTVADCAGMPGADARGASGLDDRPVTRGIGQEATRGRVVPDRDPGHLADFEVSCFQARVETILRGDPVLAMNPDKRAADISYAAMDPFMSLDRFGRDRERGLARIRQLSAGDLTRLAVHSEIGEISLANLLAEWVSHDLGHIRQLVVAAAQPFLPATGPWRPGYKHLELSPNIAVGPQRTQSTQRIP